MLRHLMPLDMLAVISTTTRHAGNYNGHRYPVVRVHCVSQYCTFLLHA